MALCWQLNAQETYPNSRYPENPKPEKQVSTEKEVKKTKFSYHKATRNFGKRQRAGGKAYNDFNWELDKKKLEYHKRMIYQIKQNRLLEKKRQKYKHVAPADICYPSSKYRKKKKFLFF